MGNICSCFLKAKTGTNRETKNRSQGEEQLENKIDKPSTATKDGTSKFYTKPQIYDALHQANNNTANDHYHGKAISTTDILITEGKNPQQTDTKPSLKTQLKSFVKRTEDYEIHKESCLEQQNIENIVKGLKVVTSMTHSSREILLRSCKKSKIFILDITHEITIDHCSDTMIFCAPCSGKITVSNSRNMKLVLASSKLEIIKSKECEINLFCSSSPVLINSTDICFSNFPQVGYYDLIEQFHRCGLQVWNNMFLEVSDMNQNLEEEHFFQKKHQDFEIGLDKILEEQRFDRADPIVPIFWRDLNLKKRNIVLIMNEPIREIQNKLLKYIVSKNVSIYKSYKGSLSEDRFKKIKEYFPQHEVNSYLCLMVGKELEISGFEAYFERISGEDGIAMEKLIFPGSTSQL